MRRALACIDRWAPLGDVTRHPNIAAAILDRLVHNAYRIDLKGESLRKTKQSTIAQPAA